MNEKSALKKTLLALGIFLLFVNIALLFQRSIYAAYFFAVVVIIIGTKNKKAIIFGIFLISLLGLFLGHMTLQRYARDNMSVANFSDFGRLQSLYAGIEMWKSSPVLGIGHGIGRFRSVEYETFPHKIDGDVAFPIHNIFIQQLAETGLVGFLLSNTFTAMLLLALYSKFKGKKNAVKESPYELFYFIAISIYIINSMLHPINFREGYLWYLYAGAIILLRDENG